LGRTKQATTKKQTAVYYTPKEIKDLTKQARLKGMRFSQYVRVVSLRRSGIKIEDENL